MGMADAATVLWTRFLSTTPRDPAWPDRDRFVLSAGHGSMLLYSLLHLAGYDLSVEDLRQFRQLELEDARPPRGHAHAGRRGDDGPLGQGICERPSAWRSPSATLPPGSTGRHLIVDHHLRDRERRRPHGGRRTRHARSPAPGARRARRAVGRQRYHHRRPDRPRLPRGRRRRATRPSAGTSSATSTGTTTRPSRTPSRRRATSWTGPA